MVRHSASTKIFQKPSDLRISGPAVGVDTVAEACRAEEVQALRQCPEEARVVTDQHGQCHWRLLRGKTCLW